MYQVRRDMCICVSWNNNIYWYEVTGVRWALVFCCVVHAWPFFGCLALLHALGLITKSALPYLTLRCVSLREIDPNSLCFAASCAHPWLAFFFFGNRSSLFSPLLPSLSVRTGVPRRRPGASGALQGPEPDRLHPHERPVRLLGDEVCGRCHVRA